jgi:demethylmenaquinone methyltransferase/2-methoxy-6-polyprenyl-1,4-benzoquinol methylase
MRPGQTSPPTRPAWDQDTLRAPHAQADKAARVRAMFDAIAPTYERVNSVVSLRRDAAWRRKAVAAAEVCPSDVVLDICCGTGDMIRAFAACNPSPKLIIGVDFAGQMLASGRYDGVRTPIRLLRADGLRLPLGDETVSVISCAFGVRNFQDLHEGLCEMRRVLRPGGRVVILEFALPENALARMLYRFYCERVLPRLAMQISRDESGAYRYLPQSIRTFERRDAMVGRLERAGLTNVIARPMHFGGVVIYRGEKGSGEGGGRD